MQHRYGSAFALILIVMGTLLFLDNLGVLPIRHIGAYWPLALVVWGALIIEHRRSAHAIIWASTLIVSGCLLVLGNLGIIYVTAGVIWPLLLIAFGAIMLVGRYQWPADTWPSKPFHAGSRTRQSFFGNRLMESIIFSGAQLRVESQNFEGGKVDAVFGGIELDLSGAAIAASGRHVVLEANAIFGGIEITVPRTWRVEKTGAAVFGGFDDQTVPPRPEPGFEPPTLRVRGAAVFGGVAVKN